MNAFDREVLGLLGIVLLLPGICSVFFSGVALIGHHPGALLLGLLGLMLGAGGIYLIRRAFRK